MNGTFPQFPFYDAVPHELFSQIKGAQYTFHNEVRVSEDTKGIVAKLLVVQPQARLTATELRAELEEVIIAWRAMIPPPPRDAQKVQFVRLVCPRVLNRHFDRVIISS